MGKAQNVCDLHVLENKAQEHRDLARKLRKASVLQHFPATLKGTKRYPGRKTKQSLSNIVAKVHLKYEKSNIEKYTTNYKISPNEVYLRDVNLISHPTLSPTTNSIYPTTSTKKEKSQ